MPTILNKRSYDEHANWHLGVDDEASEHTKWTTLRRRWVTGTCVTEFL